MRLNEIGRRKSFARVYQRHCDVKALTRARLLQALPLAQMLVPDLTAAEWRRFGATLGMAKRDRRGVLVVETERGYLQGLCAYRVNSRLGRKLVLTVEHFLALDLIDVRLIVAPLLKAIEDKAREHDCRSVDIVLPVAGKSLPRNPIATSISQSGYHPVAIQLTKILGPN